MGRYDILLALKVPRQCPFVVEKLKRWEVVDFVVRQYKLCVLLLIRILLLLYTL